MFLQNIILHQKKHAQKEYKLNLGISKFSRVRIGLNVEGPSIKMQFKTYEMKSMQSHEMNIIHDLSRLKDWAISQMGGRICVQVNIIPAILPQCGSG